MALSSEIVSQFAKLAKSDKPKSSESTVYGTIVEHDGSKYVKLDGSDLLTPVSSTTNVEADERVTVMIKDHTATVTGNLSSPSARTAEVSAIGSKISDFEIVVAEKVDTAELVAAEARIKNLEADNVEINKTLTANSASINELETTKLSAESADLKYANIDFSNIGEAAMEYFYATSGLIKNVTVGDQTITGNLVGVTISGDLIEGNTIVADKLVIKGDDGLYYKLNTDGMSVETEQTDYNSLNGSIIKANSITATKINVDDLVAFDATIGGFNISDSAIYSGVKESVDNTTPGIYLDKTGQVAFGDADSYIKYFKDTDGTYKLDISAAAIHLSSGKNIGSAITDLENRIIESGNNVTYVQLEEPTGVFNVGDTWIKAAERITWEALLNKTWGEAKEITWGNLGFGSEPITHVWDGSKWRLTIDYNEVVNHTTLIEQNAKAIELKAGRDDPAKGVITSSVKIDDNGVNMTGGEINVNAGSSMKIKSGGTFEVESDNFNVTPEGNVSMKDATVSGNLSQDGYSVLTKRNLIISSTQPRGVPNAVWIKPLSNTVLTYQYGISVNTSFAVFNSAKTLEVQGSAASASATTYKYTLRIPYTVKGSPLQTRTLTARISSGGSSVSMTSTLSNTMGYTGALELTATSNVWLGSSSTLSLTMTLDAESTTQDYDFHRITPGTIEVVCSASSSGSSGSGWTSAEVYVYQ